MTTNISAMQNMKNTPTRGADSDDAGIVSATRSMKTVVANINVTETDKRSPDSVRIRVRILLVILPVVEMSPCDWLTTDSILLVTRSPSDGIPREIRSLEVLLDEAVGQFC